MVEKSDVWDPATNKTTFMLEVTINNITGRPHKYQAVFSIILVIFTFCMFTMMFFYWRRSLEWRYRKHSHSDKFLEQDIALHSLMVTNLPQDVNVKAMSQKLKDVFNKLFGDKIIQAKVSSSNLIL